MDRRRSERGRQGDSGRPGGGDPDGPLQIESALIVLIFLISLASALHRLFG